MRHFWISLVLAPPAGAQPVSPVPVVARSNALPTVSAEGKSLQAPDLDILNAAVATRCKTVGEALAAKSRAMENVIASYASPASPSARFRPAINTPPCRGERAEDHRLPCEQLGVSVPTRSQELPPGDRYGGGRPRQLGERPVLTMDNPEPALDQARAQAVQQARKRANPYARAAGLRIVRILSNL